MPWYVKVREVALKFKDGITTVMGFIPLVYVVIDTFNDWAAGGSADIGKLLMALCVAIATWFIGKRPAL
jgi:hypothetical protein